MADPKVRIDENLKQQIVEEVKNNPEYSSQKSFVNKAVKRLLEKEKEELSDKQRQAIKDIIKKELED